MAALRMPWAPRLIQAGRVFRLPVVARSVPVQLEAGLFTVLSQRWSQRDGAWLFYLQAPEASGDYPIGANQDGETVAVEIQVCTFDQLRQPFQYNGAWWPRRWPEGQAWHSSKERQTLQDMPVGGVDESALAWWLAQDDATIWAQLPPAELPKAHFVNVHQGCPSCGTAIFSHGGFYPWKRSHRPVDFRSTCPQCAAVFPSNDVAASDFSSGDFVDDGYGYFDTDGHIFLFAATYHRDQVRSFGAAVQMLTNQLRSQGPDPHTVRRLGLMLVRYAAEEVYLSAVPQFRYGPTLGEEQPWDWGQPDWAAGEDPLKKLVRHGTQRYCIDTPYISETLALAYDTIWPFLRTDQELVERVGTQGLELEGPPGVISLIEEMLAGLLQCALDGGASSNLPRVSMGVMTLLRGLDRADGAPVLEWLYDQGPDRLRIFGVNNFFPDGTPPESTGGYNRIHSEGLFALEYHLRQLRQARPDSYSEADFPSLLADSRAPLVALQPQQMSMIGRSYFQFGDGAGAEQKGAFGADDYPAMMALESLQQAADLTGDERVGQLYRDAVEKRHWAWPSTVHDGVGIALLRTGETPERAAAGIVYGDTPGHRHHDLLDVQLFAFERPFLTDLGYPQSWASRTPWEAHWATHNSVWGVVTGLGTGLSAGRGRLVRSLILEGVQVLEVAAQRWDWDGQQWYRPGVEYRRLLALVETDGEGVVLVDLARISGGVEHWRHCRGLEGDFTSEEAVQQRRDGTMAGVDVERGQLDHLAHADYAALAYMDQVAQLQAASSWRGQWEFHREAEVFLDVHQVAISPDTEVFSARATAAMGTPEESTYRFSPLFWRRRPEDPGDSTCVDLVFEPRIGAATLVRAQGIGADRAGASGVELEMVSGRRLRLYWAPESGEGDETVFADGARLQGTLAVVGEDYIGAVGAQQIEAGQRRAVFTHAVQQGTVVSLERDACVVEVEGLEAIEAGDRLVINPTGRGHNYRVEEAVKQEQGWRLRLDVTALLGRVRVVAVRQGQIECDFHVMARSGNLHATRLLRGNGDWVQIEAAYNPNSLRTVVQVAEQWAGQLETGEWLEIVDYCPGDPVRFEPSQRG
ncbi:MAG: hypothetical protein GKR89_20405 [Candidatus Latescibacteria bacterium]|nr:hypothetical protein [Candidatus Latescibacterota bacterium]